MKDIPSQAANQPANPSQLVAWLESQPPDLQLRHVLELYSKLLEEASQPKSVSGQACVKLCGLVEQASTAQSDELRTWALSDNVTLSLLDFFMDWNESDHHRSMNLVLDLIVRLIKRTWHRDETQYTKRVILDTLVSIIAGRSTKPVPKSAIKTLDTFLSQRIVTLDELRLNYLSQSPDTASADKIQGWKSIVSDLLHWMQFHIVCPTSGRFIVSLYRRWRQMDEGCPAGPTMEIWIQWLVEFLAEQPSMLESIKNYIFMPLFKADRMEGSRLIAKLNEAKPLSATTSLDLTAPTLLQLAALETGKKLGLVEEPELGKEKSAKTGDACSITVHATMLESSLVHPSHDVRILALSLLLSSPSTTKPFSEAALNLLRKHMGNLFAEPDAKFRVEVSGKVRDMFKRLRGAVQVLKRSIPRARANARKTRPKFVNDLPESESSVALEPITYRSNLIHLPETQLIQCLQHHEEFLRWYMTFLCNELIPTASYQRHVASLKAILLILRVEGEEPKKWETDDDQWLFYDLIDYKWTRALMDLLMDPFEDVRDGAASALKYIYLDERYRHFSLSRNTSARLRFPTLTELSKKAGELARRTSRADHSDGASRVSQLLFQFSDSNHDRVLLVEELVAKLGSKVSAAESDLGVAVLDAPLHGDFASLSRIWQVILELQFDEPECKALQVVQKTVVSHCERVWLAVKDILCDDSPEGHLPQDLEETPGLDTKDILSFSFRAIHESSNLMRLVVLSIRNRTREGFLSPPTDLYERIGYLTFDQLCSLRHRGAFSTVAATFSTCCQQTKHLVQGDMLLDAWYQGTFDSILCQASTTRRSAGIPSMITAILSANAPSPSFQQVMERLMSIASQEASNASTDGTKLPQVHAYNCLKDIYRNSTLNALGNQSEKYLPKCLELAASGLRSEVWAIRNCGLIFLRSLIDCLFGSQESKAMIEAGWDGKANRIPYHRYPNLANVLRNLLRSGHQMLSRTTVNLSAAESVFPALDIIRRAGPPELLRHEIQVDVAVYLASPVWHVRELAARTMCSCLLHKDWLPTIGILYQDVLRNGSGYRQNHIHGLLLTIRFVVERLADVDEKQLRDDMPALIHFLYQISIDATYSHCPDILAAYLEIMNHIWTIERASSQPLSAFQLKAHTNGASALLRQQRVLSEVYAASVDHDAIARVSDILLNSKLGIENLVTAVEALPKLWDAERISREALLKLCRLYVDICLQVGAVEGQTVAMQNLGEVLDELLRRNEANDLLADSLVELWIELTSQPLSPSLFNAIVRASGSIVAVSRWTSKRPSLKLGSWGRMMSVAGLDDKAFDTRLAAAESVRSYFAAIGPCCTTEDHLPCLLALYDILNDDDDEIRAVGSTTVESITGDALAATEAVERLLDWMRQHLGGSASFKKQVANRMVGQGGLRAWDTDVWESAEKQLANALRFDDSLFAVEEQNLFVDEVRETERWIDVFSGLRWDDSAGTDVEILSRLEDWMANGVVHLTQMLRQDDGPLGWASHPRAFAIGTRLVRGSVAVMRQHETKGLRNAVVRAKTLLRCTDHARVSGLLTAAWEAGDENKFDTAG